jgi:tRNA pseudouridine13 synthase
MVSAREGNTVPSDDANRSSNHLMGPDSLPFITPELPGIGGQLKAEPTHFVVEEIPLYEAGGSGAHLYLSLTREGWNTKRVADALADLFSLNRRDVGFAGLKDRNARCTQTFSLPGLAPEDAERIEPALPFQVNWARQHSNKLKVGHLLGNRFCITVSELAVPPDEALSRSQVIAAAVAERGVPNFFGPQRFGHEGGNVAKGRAMLLGQAPRRDPWLAKLLVSAYQSHLFNRYLVRRIESGLFGQLIQGDVCKKAETGGMFQVQDAPAEQPRYQRGEITFTGPIYGKKMWAAQGPAAELEASVLAEAELSAEDLQRARVDGSRRPARLWLPVIELAADGQGLQVNFNLPKGAYATVILREFIKSEQGLELLQEENEE